MIDESRPRMRSRTGANRRLRTSQALVSLATVGGLVLGGMVLAAPGQAHPPDDTSNTAVADVDPESTPDPVADPVSDIEESGDGNNQGGDGATEPSESGNSGNDAGAKRPSHKPTEEESAENDNVCPPLDSGKIDTADGPMSVTVPNSEVTPPDGALIYEYCVKAGSVNQGLGPKTVPVIPPSTSVTITYPAADKEISHYSVAWRMPSMGSLEIIKELSNPDDAPVPSDFAIGYECKIDDDVTKSGSVDVAPGEDGEMVSGIPVGSTCAITEEELTPIEGFTWADVMYDPKSVDIESAGETFTVKVKNKITKKHGGGGGGGLELVKELTGGPDDYTGPFTIEYECTKEDKTPVSGSEEVSAGSPVLVSDIGNGYECVVSEPLLPNPPTGYSFEDPTFDPVDATVKTKGKEAVTVITRNTLTRDEGNLRITKSLAGTPADFDPEFDVSYTCTLEGEEDITGSATISNEGTVEVPTEGSIPTGYECTVTEGALPALPAGLVWNAPGYSNNQGTDPGNVVTIVKNTVNAPDQELPIDQMATVAIANSATTPSVPVTPSSGGGVSTPAPVAPVTPVEPASPVEPAVPVEPASPVEPAVPVEPASPETPAAVEPAGVPLLVPAGGGAASGITDDLPVAAYLLVLLGMGTAVGGAAYLLRSR